LKIRIFEVEEWGPLYSFYFSKKGELTTEQIQQFLISQKYNMYFAYIKNKVVGFIIYAKLPNSLAVNCYFIEYLCVNGEYQKYGIGKKLIEMFISNLPGDASCGLNCEGTLIKYYEKFGFSLDEFILECQGEKYFTMTKGNISGKKLLELMFIEYWH
jgi:ribosomal protein S18 acetylase RimI-like enzyme